MSSATDTSLLAGTLDKMYSLLPSSSSSVHLSTPSNSLDTPPHVVTHLLHLSSESCILPHVDNVQASAGTIVGICLGTTRELVLREKTKGNRNADHITPSAATKAEIRLKLEPGCAYLQRSAEMPFEKSE